MAYIKNEVSKDSPYYVLLGFIPVGKENAVSMSTLSRFLNLDERQVRQLVLNARKTGLIIASGKAGYYIPYDREELLKYYLGTKKREGSAKLSVWTVLDKLLEGGEIEWR